MAEKFKTAEEMGSEQREISVAEFFEKNRHLLGFDNPSKALMTVVREAVDNGLDACEEGGILPVITVKLKQLSEDRVKVIVQDNGPGIVKAQIPKIFAKLLYGSKFFKLSQSRGQQGIGISAALLYAQLTTGKSVIIRSRTDEKKPVNEFHLRIDTLKNEPEIMKDQIYEKSFPNNGVYIEMEIEGKYRRGSQSVDEYLKQTALANPFAKIIYTNPDGNKIIYNRVVDFLPRRPKSIKPHPYGVELGVFERMMRNTRARNISGFLSNDFSRVSSSTAREISKLSKVDPGEKTSNIGHDETERLWRTLQKTKLMNPPLDCLSPISQDVLETAVSNDLHPEFVAAITRPPSVYRGNPFGIEVAIGYGGDLKDSEGASVIRIANRVPLIYEASACAITKEMKKIDWRHYRIDHQNRMPIGPLIIMVHMYSTWIPYTSEGKEAIDAYPEISKEIRLGLQDCLRKIGRFLAGRKRKELERQRTSLFEKYIPELATTISTITEWKKDVIEKDMLKIVSKEPKKIESDTDE